MPLQIQSCNSVSMIRPMLVSHPKPTQSGISISKLAQYLCLRKKFSARFELKRSQRPLLLSTKRELCWIQTPASFAQSWHDAGVDGEGSGVFFLRHRSVPRAPALPESWGVVGSHFWPAHLLACVYKGTVQCYHQVCLTFPMKHTCFAKARFFFFMHV